MRTSNDDHNREPGEGAARQDRRRHDGLQDGAHESKGDIESAVDWLRKKGLSKAAKKAGRIAAEGLIGVTAKDKAGAMVEVNSETDFVARNEQFQDMVRKIAALAPKADGDVAKLLAMTYPGKA